MVRQTRARIAAVLALGILAGAYAFGESIMRREPPMNAAMSDVGPDKGWQAVAPGRVEPRSGVIKISGTAVGLVGEVLVGTNDKVFTGEPLIRLQDDEARARLAATEAEVGLRLRLRDSRSASGKAEDRRDAEDALSEAETAVFDARSAVDSAAAARRAGRGSDATLEAARAALSRAQKNLQARAAALRAIEADSPLPRESEARLSTARAERSVARAVVDKMTIRAPIAGTVLQVNVKVGEAAPHSSAQPLLLLGDVSSLRVRAEVDERDLTEIKIGQPVVVRAAALPGREFSGKVAFIAPIVEPARINARGPRNPTDVDVVEVLVDLDETEPLVPGMKVDTFFRRSELAEQQQGARR